jgi:hypothetical protein
MADHPMRNDPTNFRDHFAVPLGSLTSGSLRFTNGAHRITIRTESYMRDLVTRKGVQRICNQFVTGG